MTQRSVDLEDMSDNQHNVDAKSLLQADATMLAGALIFLVLVDTLHPLTGYLLLSGIWAFAASICVCIIKPNDDGNAEIFRKWVAIAGTLLLFVAVGTYIIILRFSH